MSNTPNLEELSRAELLERWRAVFGPPPPKLSQTLMRRMLAYDQQIGEQGELASEARRALAAALKDNAARPLHPGTRLIREWNGVVHEVETVEGGYLWRGEVWRSLSAIATAITGVKWSGARFFGLKR